MTDASLTSALIAISRSEELSHEQLESAFSTLLGGDFAPEQAGAFLMGLAVRGETGQELLAGAKVMRANARRIELSGKLLDTCGTGGLAWTSLNTSTASALVIAACGGKVAKHGNRSVPPKTGSADVLEALGVELDLTEARFRACLDQANVGFLFARTHHSAMRHIAPIRQSLRIRTIFNLLGPLSNPAGATHQILGVYDPRWLHPMAEALRDLGIERAWVVHGPDQETGGIDEVSIAGETQIVEVRHGTLHELSIFPEDAGLDRLPLSALQGGKAHENGETIRELIGGRTGPFREAVLLNAAAGLLVFGLVDDLRTGVERAAEALDSGAVQQTLSVLCRESQGASK